MTGHIDGDRDILEGAGIVVHWDDERNHDAFPCGVGKWDDTYRSARFSSVTCKVCRDALAAHRGSLS